MARAVCEREGRRQGIENRESIARETGREQSWGRGELARIARS